MRLTTAHHDNFFELGGDSLAGVQVIAHMNRELGLQVTVPQFFEAPNASQNFGGRKPRRQRFGFAFCSGQLATLDSGVGPQNIRLPKKENLDQPSAAAHVLTFGQRLVIIFTLVQPRAIGGILVASDLGFFQFLVSLLDLFPNPGQQAMQTLGHSIGVLNAPRFLGGSVSQ